jgi:outer membrane cobalamin receptor
VAQYGTAFRAPTFNELYYPFFGNPTLEPEESRSAELAARGQAGGVHWRVSLFDTHIDDLIGFDANYAPANIDKARILGVETGATLAVRDWTVEAGLTFLDPESSAGFTDGNQLHVAPSSLAALMSSAVSRNGRWARAWPARARASMTAPTAAAYQGSPCWACGPNTGWVMPGVFRRAWKTSSIASTRP